MIEYTDGLYLVTTSTYGVPRLRFVTASTASEARKIIRIVEPHSQILSVEPAYSPPLKRFNILINYSNCPSGCSLCADKHVSMSYRTVALLARDEACALATLNATECPLRRYEVHKVLCSDQRKEQ